MSAVGMDVAVIGNHEFDRGVENYAEMISRYSTFPVLAANYLYEDPDLPGATNMGNISSPYALYNLEGLRVAVIGLGNFSSITSLRRRAEQPGHHAPEQHRRHPVLRRLPAPAGGRDRRSCPTSASTMTCTSSARWRGSTSCSAVTSTWW